MALINPKDDEISSNAQEIKTEPLWTVTEVATYLRLEADTVRLMARRRELPSIKVGKRLWRFKPSEIKDWVIRSRTDHIE